MASAMAGILTKFIPIQQRALRGFILLSMQEWQIKTKKFIKDSENSSLEEQFQVVDNVNVILIRKLTRVLNDEKDKKVLEIGIAEGTKILRDMLRKRLAN